MHILKKKVREWIGRFHVHGAALDITCSMIDFCILQGETGKNPVDKVSTVFYCFMVID